MPNEILQGFEVGSGIANRRLENARANQLLQLQQQKFLQDAAEFQEAQTLRRAEQQRKAQIESIRYQGLRDFEAAQQAGMTAAEAFSKYGASMTYGGGDIGSFLNQADSNRIREDQNRISEGIRQQLTNIAQQRANAYDRSVDPENGFSPSIITLKDPNTGKDVSIVKTGPKSSRPLTNTPDFTPEIISVSNPVTGEQVPILKKGPRSAQPIAQDAGKRQEHMAMLNWALKNAPDLMKIDESTGQAFLPPENFTEASKRASLTTSTKGKNEQQMQDTESVFYFGKKLLPLLTSENVGVRGAISRNLIENGAGMLFPWMKIGEATETLSVAKEFNAALIKTLRSDGNIAEAERKSIEGALPSAEQLLKSPQAAKIQLATQLERAGTLSRVSAQRLGKPVAPFFMTWDELRKLVADGKISFEESKRLWDNNAWKMIDSIKAEVQR